MMLIWGIKKEAAPGQELKIKDAVAFLKGLEEEGARIIVPAPVLAELLAQIPEDRLEMVAGQISSQFLVLPFDSAAAVIAAQLLQTINGKGVRKALANEGVTKRRMSFDLEVAAIAIANRAERLYSSDEAMSKIACGRVAVLDLPKAYVPELDFEGPHRALAREAAHRVESSPEKSDAEE